MPLAWSEPNAAVRCILAAMIRRCSPCVPTWIAALVLLALHGSCGAVERGTPHDAEVPPLVAVSNFLHPPFSSRDEDGSAVGLEVDLVAEAARRLGRQVVWVERPFGELLLAVARGEADVAASTIGITQERAKLVTFSRSYYDTTIVALVRTGADEPRTLTHLSGRRIGTERSTTAVAAAAERTPKALRVLDRAEGRSWAEMLAAGEIDGVVLDHSHASKFMADAGTRFHVVEEPLQVERFGLALHHDATELRAVLDTVIAERGSPGGVGATPRGHGQ